LVGGNSSFIIKIVSLVGGAVVLMIVIAVAVNIFFGDKTNYGTIISIAQTEHEITRLSTLSKASSDQLVINAAANTGLSIDSQEQAWMTFLKNHRQKVDDKVLLLKKDPTTDKKLQTAQTTSTFDVTYVQVMRQQLEAYGNQLKAAYKGATNQQERSLMSSQYDGVQLLLKQWPPVNSSQ
jgi:hypothetical protein